MPEQLLLEFVHVVHQHDDPVSGPELRVVNGCSSGSQAKRADRWQQGSRHHLDLLHQQLLETVEEPIGKSDRQARLRRVRVVSGEELGSDFGIRASQGTCRRTHGHETSFIGGTSRSRSK